MLNKSACSFLNSDYCFLACFNFTLEAAIIFWYFLWAMMMIFFLKFSCKCNDHSSSNPLFMSAVSADKLAKLKAGKASLVIKGFMKLEQWKFLMAVSYKWIYWKIALLKCQVYWIFCSKFIEVWMCHTSLILFVDYQVKYEIKRYKYMESLLNYRHFEIGPRTSMFFYWHPLNVHLFWFELFESIELMISLK